MKIIIAHPSWPWQDEALSVCLHKPNVYIDLSGWSPKYFPPQARAVRQHAAQDAHVVRVGLSTDHAGPLDQGLREAGFKPEVHDLILKQNAIRALGLDACEYRSRDELDSRSIRDPIRTLVTTAH
jgi:predicted TIM-barrel fold metal-dependent hydrolase